MPEPTVTAVLAEMLAGVNGMHVLVAAAAFSFGWVWRSHLYRAASRRRAERRLKGYG